MRKIKSQLLKNLDDLLLLGGCVCILYGLHLWSEVVMWIAAGLMLGGWAYLIGKVRAHDTIE